MLNSLEAVIEALGGPAKAAELGGVGPSAVSNWKARGKFPSELFVIFSDALAENGSTAERSLFAFREPAAEQPAEART